MREGGMLIIFAFFMIIFSMLSIVSMNNSGTVIVISEQEFLKRQREAEYQEAKRKADELYEKREVCKILIIDYEVEYGSIYTGNQTPIKHRGVYKSNLMCGMKNTDVTALIPLNMAMPLTLNNGREGDLWLPFCKLLNGEPFGFLQFNQGGDSVKMIINARMEKSEEDLVLTLFVKAAPATEAQWNGKKEKTRI